MDNNEKKNQYSNPKLQKIRVCKIKLSMFIPLFLMEIKKTTIEQIKNSMKTSESDIEILINIIKVTNFSMTYVIIEIKRFLLENIQ